MKKIIYIISLIVFFTGFANLNAASTTTSTTDWSDINPPQWALDLRRTEIITLGSLPFVTLWSTVGYSLAVKGSFHNPLNKSTSTFDETDQWNIIKISCAGCIGLGLFDLTFNFIKRNMKERRGKKITVKQAVEVLPFSTQQKQRDDLNPPLPPPLPEYFDWGIESAIY